MLQLWRPRRLFQVQGTGPGRQARPAGMELV